MPIKENEQPTYLHGHIAETVINTLAVVEIQVPRILGNKELFDIDEIFIETDKPIPTLGADAEATCQGQVVISENEPTAMLDTDDDRVLAEIIRLTYANATDRLWTGIMRGKNDWTSMNHANLVPDDKLWLLVQQGSSRAGVLGDAWCRIKGKLAKVTQADFEALILSRLGQ